ncbi:hypothetical protein Y032_0073g761 [Ancylostoma ceylanicum]|uniref:Uncharacterized protein n=3 Tax=Ancylostoma ceylanicum TaxID=53326 RepID=A0A016TV32_9BILA|nr:hypothetical protein Y032_0073g761 [Ancylostoma ceylanicum]
MKLTECTAWFSNTKILVLSIIAAAEKFNSMNILNLSPLPPCLRSEKLVHVKITFCLETLLMTAMFVEKISARATSETSTKSSTTTNTDSYASIATTSERIITVTTASTTMPKSSAASMPTFTPDATTQPSSSDQIVSSSPNVAENSPSSSLHSHIETAPKTTPTSSATVTTDSTATTPSATTTVLSITTSTFTSTGPITDTTTTLSTPTESTATASSTTTTATPTEPTTPTLEATTTQVVTEPETTTTLKSLTIKPMIPATTTSTAKTTTTKTTPTVTTLSTTTTITLAKTASTKPTATTKITTPIPTKKATKTQPTPVPKPMLTTQKTKKISDFTTDVMSTKKKIGRRGESDKDMNKSLIMVIAVSGVGVVALCALLVVLKTYRRSKTGQQRKAATPATTITISKTTDGSPERKGSKRNLQSPAPDFNDFKSRTMETTSDYRGSDQKNVVNQLLDGDPSFEKDGYSEGLSKDERNQGVAMPTETKQQYYPDGNRFFDNDTYSVGVANIKVDQIERSSPDGNRNRGKAVFPAGVNDMKVKKTKKQPPAGGYFKNKNVQSGGVGGAKTKRAKQRKPMKNVASRQKTQRKIKMVKTPVMQKNTKTGKKSRAKTVPKLSNKARTKQKGTPAHKKVHPKKQKAAVKKSIKAKQPKGAEFLELVSPLEQHKLDNEYENIQVPKSPGYYNLNEFI